MSLNRLIFYSAMIGGWTAFVGWMLSEILFLHRSSDLGVMAIFWATALVGAFIAGGLTLLGGVASGTLQGQWLRFFPGLALGFVAGALGGTVGNLIYSLLPNIIVRILGWTIMGLAIGAVEGICDVSPKKIRNGLIGGGVGGFLGGLLFDPIVGVIGGIMSSRATAFVILGMCIGCFVGLAQVILKEAWLTVEEGFRPGRQLLLNNPEIIMGTSEKAALPFIAFGAKGVEPIHLRILRRDDGSYLLQDNNSRTGTFVNGQHVQGAVVLRNDDVIQLGVNKVRFREVHKSSPAPLPAVAVARPMNPPPAAIAAGPPAAAKAGAPPMRPKAHPPRATGRESPIAAGPPVGKPAPRPAAKPPSPMPAPAAAAQAAAAAQGCPICGRIGAAVPQSKKRRCASCGILY